MTTTFLKLRCERAYATGAVRTPLNLREFAAKMKRLGMKATADAECVHIALHGATWTFADWQQNGLENVGCLRFTTDGHIGVLSDKLAAAGVRHRFEHSRPLDLDCDDIRCVTSYDHRWQDFSLAPGRNQAVVETYDEPVDAAAAAVARS